MPVLLRRAKEQGLKIIPVILSPCLFHETHFKFPDPKSGPETFTLGSLQAAASPRRTLNEIENKGEQDRILLSVAQNLLAYGQQRVALANPAMVQHAPASTSITCRKAPITSSAASANSTNSTPPGPTGAARASSNSSPPAAPARPR